VLAGYSPTTPTRKGARPYNRALARNPPAQPSGQSG